MEIEDDGFGLTVRVIDPAPDPAPIAVPDRLAPPGAAPYDPDAHSEELAEEEAIALALVRGLADRVQVGPGPGGGTGSVAMTWRRR
jgi:hypothetical protein